MAIVETFSEIRELLQGIVKWVIVLFVMSFYFFIFPFDKPFSVQVFEMMRSDLVPDSVNLIVSNPFTAFLIQMQISIFLSLLFAFPFLLWSILKYLSPALKQNEKNALYKVVIPSVVLFFTGCLFSYKYIIPATIRILYSYTSQINATPLFNIGDFVSLSVGFMAVTGLMFLMPVIMFLTSAIGIIPYELWKKYWRHTILFFVIFTAVITPDGTGITMILLMIPLSVLYLGGLFASRRFRLKGASN